MDFQGGGDLSGNDDAGDVGNAGPDGLDDLDLADELATLVAEQQRFDGYADRVAADYATLNLGSPTEYVHTARITFRNAATMLDRVLPALESHRIAHPVQRLANVVARGSEYDLPVMDDAIGRTFVTLDAYFKSPAAARVFVSMNEINPVVRDRKLAQDARSIAAIGMYNSVATCIHRMSDLNVAAQTIETVTFENLMFGDIDKLLEVARHHPDLRRKRYLTEYLFALEHAIHQPFDSASDTVIDRNNPFAERVERDLATARAAYLAAHTDTQFSLAFLRTLPAGPVRDAATLPVIKAMGVDATFDHHVQVLHLLSHEDPQTRAERAASYAFGCGTNDAPFAFRWFRDDVAEYDPSLSGSKDWLGVFFARGLMRLSFESLQTAIVLTLNLNEE